MTVAAALPAGVVACYFSGLTLAPGSIGTLLAYAVTVTIALCMEPSRFGRLTALITAADAFLLFLLIGVVGAVGTYVAMRHSGALTDDLLSDADHLLGFDWPRLRAATERRPTVLMVMQQAYSACFLMPLLVVTLLPATGRIPRLYRYLAVHCAALAATVVVAFFFPARAAFAYYGHAAVPGNAAHYGRIIDGLRDGSLMMIDVADLGGIVTFPSFHATMAILFVWALWPVRILRAPVLAVNALMWASAVPIGGHYVVDLLGGSAIALLAVAVMSPRPVRGPGRAAARPSLA